MNKITMNKYGNWRDSDGRVGTTIDQYPSLKVFMIDIWERYRPFGGKCLFDRLRLKQVGNTDQLICEDIDSKFYREEVENYYLTRPDRYIDLRQHYFCSEYKSDIWSAGECIKPL